VSVRCDCWNIEQLTAVVLDAGQEDQGKLVGMFVNE
jgi:hypothetical protein